MISGHEIRFLADDEMPDGTDWMLLEVDDEVHCILRRSRVCEKTLEEAWAGYRALAASQRTGLDAQERRRLDDALDRIELHLMTG
jgi:hypothetical protein